jgi:hypothetical protein
MTYLKKLLDPLLNYFRRTKNYSRVRFIIEMVVVAFITKVIFGLIYSLATGDVGEGVDQGIDDLLQYGWGMLVLSLTLFASLETLIGQWLIIWITSKFTGNLYIKLFASAAVFSALHIDPILIATVFPIGIILAWSFILYRRQSRWSAFCITTAIHLIHNLIAASLIWLE